MALKATIFKAELGIADLDRHYYHTHHLTLARHPSETDTRLMVRLLAFALHAHEDLQFTRGLSTEDEPDLWRKDLSGDIALWIELGQPDEKRLRKACGRAQQVVIYSYSGSSAELWWRGNGPQLQRFANLTVVNLPAASGQALATLAQRHMRLQCTIEDDHCWLGDGEQSVEVALQTWKAAG
jgi:uncharacterized protein YaeQ